MLIARLEDRSVFTLSGEDTLTFLQGIVTNDVDILKDGDPCYTALLSPQGKFLDDFFLVADEDRIIADCNRDRRDALIRRLSMYKLRADVLIEPADDLAVYALFSAEAEDIPDFDATISYVDPRHPALGKRIILPEAGSDALISRIDANQVSNDIYREFRLGQAIPEGTTEIEPEKAYPLEFGLEKLNGISFSKGCYVGQEVTTRMKIRKLVKRQPAVIANPDKITIETGDAVSLGGKKIGEIRSAAGAYAVALIENAAAEKLSSGGTVEINGTELPLSLPGWMETTSS